jgi:hypothetical protein
MENLGLVTIFISQLLANLPTVLVCAVACGLILMNRRKITAAPRLALWGFGLAVGLGIVMPLLSGTLQIWLIRSDGPTRLSNIQLMGLLHLIGALLHASTYGLLLMAILTPAKSREGSEPDA